MDTAPCREGWLSFLTSKINDQVKAAGVRLERSRTAEGVLHVLGYVVDFQLFQTLKLDFLPQLPQYDVGDRVTITLREAGYHVFACQNTASDPMLANEIPLSSPLHDLPVDRCFNDTGEVIFLHLGRAIVKSFRSPHRGTSPETWINFIKHNLLGQP
jgi:hypothetical protein